MTSTPNHHGIPTSAVGTIPGRCSECRRLAQPGQATCSKCATPEPEPEPEPEPVCARCGGSITNVRGTIWHTGDPFGQLHDHSGTAEPERMLTDREWDGLGAETRGLLDPGSREPEPEPERTDSEREEDAYEALADLETACAYLAKATGMFVRAGLDITADRVGTHLAALVGLAGSTRSHVEDGEMV